VHHIVPENGGGEFGDRARAALERPGVDLHDADNLVPLPRTTLEPGTVPEGLTRHQAIHTRRYYETLANELEATDPSRIADKLKAIRQQILDGKFPH
jgi:hypothetical protein